MDAYERRVIDGLLDELQPHLQATSIYGPKGVGKTATAERRASSFLRLDDNLDLATLRAQPDVISTLPGPVLIDEWQRYPSVWDQVRRAVDDGAEPGRFLITGSSAPRGATVHSGAGRIVGLRMRPMSLYERGIDEPTVSLARMFDGGTPIDGETEIQLDDYVDEIIASGFPGIRSAHPRLRRTLLDAYIDNIVLREFPEQGYPVRKPDTLRAWLASYAAATSTTARYNEILDAATPGQSDKPAKTTSITYRDALSQLWLLDPTSAWMPVGSTLKRLGQSPKHHLADPALAARLLQLDAQTLLTGRRRIDIGSRHGSMLGALFESLVTLDVKVYAENAEARVHHLRDKNGDHEVDLIVEGPAGRVVALEVKLAAVPNDRDVRHLLWLRDQIGDDLADVAVITTGKRAYRRQDGVAVIPAALLGP